MVRNLAAIHVCSIIVVSTQQSLLCLDERGVEEVYGSTSFP